MTVVSGQVSDASDSRCLSRAASIPWSATSSLTPPSAWMWWVGPRKVNEEKFSEVSELHPIMEIFEMDEESFSSLIHRSTFLSARVTKVLSCLIVIVLTTLIASSWFLVNQKSMHRHRGKYSPVPTNHPVPLPTNAPSRRPNDQRLEQIISCASKISSVDINNTSDPIRWKAIEYFHTGGGKNIDLGECENTESFFSTMYSMIVLRESLNVDNPTWNDDKKFVTDIWDVCKWKRLRCSRVEVGNHGELAITDLLLSHSDLDGTIPPEISGLAYLQKIAMFSNPNLAGTIPTEVGLLANMTELEFHFTGIRGNVPTSLGKLSLLSSLRLYDTRLEGTLPQEICSLINNGNLTVLEADCVMLQCNCCTKCKRLAGITEDA